MRLKSPRIAPLTDAEMTPEQAAVVKPVKSDMVLNIMRTLGRAPKALVGFKAWGGYVLSPDNDLSERQVEILTMRTVYRCRAGYAWTQHVRTAPRRGIAPEEIVRLKGAGAAGWGEHDATLVQAADELHDDQFVSDATWGRLRAFLSEKQCMDVVFVVGHYTQISMMLNSFGVPLDPGLTPDPDLEGF